jgi:hypothetical protein
MKKAIIFSVMLVLALGLFSCNGKKSKGLSITEETTSQKAPKKVLGYVDLGLPSGTLWKETNESRDYEGDLYTWDEAVSHFGDELPTKKQLEELINECEWTWTGSGYKVIGPNGNSIDLPAAGLRACGDGDVGGVGTSCYYWSSAPYDYSDFVWFLSCDSYGVCMLGHPRCLGHSVRLVQ